MKSGRIKIKVFTVILIAGLFLCCGLLFAANITGEEWLNVYLLGKKVGYGYTSTKEAVYNGEDCYEEVSYIMIKMNRGGAELVSTSNSKAYVKKDFTPIYFKSNEKLSNIEKNTEGKIENKKLKIKVTLGDQTSETEMYFPENTYLDDSLSDVIKSRGIRKGDEYKLNIFLKEAMKIIEIKVKVLGKEKVKIKDKEVYGTRIDSDVLGIIISTVVDEDYRVLRSEYKDVGMVLEKATKEEAMSIPEITSEEDILAASSIESNVKFDKQYIKKLKIRIKHPDISRVRENLSEKGRQKFTDPDILEIDSGGFKEEKALSLPMKLNAENIKFVESTFYEQSIDKDIIKKANEIKGDEKNSYMVAKKVMEWVNKNVNKKNFNVGFAGAKEVLSKKEGDCTEHSVLMSALLKALGIPTKVVGGVVYFNGRFYYHMWVKVFVGEWISMDPTLNQSPVDATHIKLAEGILNEEGLVDICIGLLPSLKTMSIEVIEYE